MKAWRRHAHLVDQRGQRGQQPVDALVRAVHGRDDGPDFEGGLANLEALAEKS